MLELCRANIWAPQDSRVLGNTVSVSSINLGYEQPYQLLVANSIDLSVGILDLMLEWIFYLFFNIFNFAFLFNAVNCTNARVVICSFNMYACLYFSPSFLIDSISIIRWKFSTRSDLFGLLHHFSILKFSDCVSKFSLHAVRSVCLKKKVTLI
jgi:hypothetical protein